MRIALSIILRDLKKNLSQKARLVASMIRPLLWLFIIGSGFNQIVDIESSGNYFSFLIPGLICMTALFTGVVSSMSMVYDKEFGFIRLLYLSPSPFIIILIAKMVSAALIAIIHMLIFSIIALLFGFLDITIIYNPLFLISLILVGLLSSIIGLIISAFSGTVENFATTMNFIIFPLFFLSESLYPSDGLNVIFKSFIDINPFSHAVIIMRESLNNHFIIPSFLYISFCIVLGLIVSFYAHSRESNIINKISK